MSQFRALETHYRGHRTRSRIEARWMVAFDHAGIAYQYEPERFVVNGIPYLPDFLLPGIGYFEVKGMLRDVPLSLYQSFADQANQYLFVAVGGIPEPDTITGYLHSFVPANNIDAQTAPLSRDLDMFLQCNHCSKVGVWADFYNGARHTCDCDDRQRVFSITDALAAARAARFEHGECG